MRDAPKRTPAVAPPGLQRMPLSLAPAVSPPLGMPSGEASTELRVRADSCAADGARAVAPPRTDSASPPTDVGEGPSNSGAALAATAPGSVASRVDRQTGGQGMKGSRGIGERKKGEQPRACAVKCAVSVHYGAGEEPMSELLRLAGGQGMDVIVEAVAPGSKAATAGVKEGFALAAMNGRNEFMQLPGWQVRLLLEAPITLGFNPAPLQPQSAKCTEIRLTRAQDTLGIPPRVNVCGPRETGLLAEEVVFDTTSAPLWLSAWGEEGLGAAPDVAAAQTPMPRLYELRRTEAHAMVGKIRGACREQQPVQSFEAEWYRSASSRSPRTGPSQSPLCSIDCVAECLDNELVFGTPDQSDPAASRQRRDPGASHGCQWGQKLPGTARAGRGDAQSRVIAAGSSGRDDRSPLRWLAPVIERVWGESLSPRGGAASPSPSTGDGRRSPRPAMARGGSPKPVRAKGDDHIDPDLSATVDGGSVEAPAPAAADPPPEKAKRKLFGSTRSDMI